jgi:hypothetical protein
MARAQAVVEAYAPTLEHPRSKRDIEDEIRYCSVRLRHYLERHDQLQDELADFERRMVAKMVAASEEPFPAPPDASTVYCDYF